MSYVITTLYAIGISNNNNNNNNNNRFTALCLGLPEETFTQSHKSWSSAS